jgi:hypothetical protein
MKELGAEQMLELWGLRVSGDSLKCPMRLSTGGEASIDDDLAAVRYVESIRGFAEARPVLVHVHVNGGEPNTFLLRLPGEPLSSAVSRLGWWMLHDLSADRMAGSVYRGFVWLLEASLRKTPFVPPSRLARLVEDPVLEGPVTPSEREQFESRTAR